MIAENNQELEIKFRAVLTELGYSKTTVNSMSRIVRKLIYWHDVQGEERLIDDIIASFLSYEETRYRSGATTRTTFLMHKQ